MRPDGPVQIGFLVFPGFPMACLTSAIEPLRAANEISQSETFAWTLLSESGEPVIASANVMFDPDLPLSQAENLDYVFLLSGPQGQFDNPQRSNGKLRHMARHGCQIGAVSGGIFPLAASGLMDGYSLSVHWCYRSAFVAKHPDLDASEDVIVINRGRLTASGASAVFDLMLLLIEERLGANVLTEVACWFQHPLVRSEGVSQSVPALKSDTLVNNAPEPVARAIEVFSRNLDVKVAIGDVANQVGVSPRQLEREFKRVVDQSPLQYYRGLRMNAARQMLIYSGDSLTGIAHAVGYSSSSTMSKHYREAFGRSPQEERRQADRFRVQGNQPLPSCFVGDQHQGPSQI